MHFKEDIGDVYAENASLRAELDATQKQYDLINQYNVDCTKEHSKLLAEKIDLKEELARVTAERDAAVEDIKALLSEDITLCDACNNGKCYRRGGTAQFCEPEWRGPKKAEEGEAK